MVCFIELQQIIATSYFDIPIADPTDDIEPLESKDFDHFDDFNSDIYMGW